MRIRIIYDTRDGYRYQKITRKRYDSVNRLLRERHSSVMTCADNWSRTYDYEGFRLDIVDAKRRPRRIILDIEKEGDLEGVLKFFGLLDSDKKVLF